MKIFNINNGKAVSNFEPYSGFLRDRSAPITATAFHQPNLRGKDWRMLMHAERAQMVGRRLDCLNTAIHSDVPQFHFSASTATDELSLSATL